MATYPVISAGARITSSLLTSMLDQYVYKTSTQTVTSSTTLVNDTELLFPVAANGMYVVEFVVYFASLQAAGFKTAWSVPAGTSGNKFVAGPGSANAVESSANTTEMRWAIHGSSTTVSYTDPRNSTGLQSFVIERATLTVGATAGNVQFQWAQNVSNATGTIVVGPSYVKYRQIG